MQGSSGLLDSYGRRRTAHGSFELDNLFRTACNHRHGSSSLRNTDRSLTCPPRAGRLPQGGTETPGAGLPVPVQLTRRMRNCSTTVPTLTLPPREDNHLVGGLEPPPVVDGEAGIARIDFVRPRYRPHRVRCCAITRSASPWDNSMAASAPGAKAAKGSRCQAMSAPSTSQTGRFDGVGTTRRSLRVCGPAPSASSKPFAAVRSEPVATSLSSRTSTSYRRGSTPPSAREEAHGRRSVRPARALVSPYQRGRDVAVSLFELGNLSRAVAHRSAFPGGVSPERPWPDS